MSRVKTYSPATPMSRKQSDPAQGVIIPATKAVGSVRAIPRKDGNAIIARAGGDVTRKYNSDHANKKTPGPNEQDWRRG